MHQRKALEANESGPQGCAATVCNRPKAVIRSVFRRHVDEDEAQQAQSIRHRCRYGREIIGSQIRMDWIVLLLIFFITGRIIRIIVSSILLDLDAFFPGNGDTT